MIIKGTGGLGNGTGGEHLKYSIVDIVQNLQELTKTEPADLQT